MQEHVGLGGSLKWIFSLQITGLVYGSDREINITYESYSRVYTV